MLTQEVKEENTIKKYPFETARKYLGRGYDKVQKTPVGRIFEDPSERDVLMGETTTSSKLCQERDLNTCIEKFTTELTASLELPFGLNIEAGRKNDPLQSNISETSCYMISRYNVLDCKLTSTLQPLKESARIIAGDGYVESLKLVMGYHLIIHSKRTTATTKENAPHNVLNLVLPSFKFLPSFKLGYSGGSNAKSTDDEHSVFKLEIKGIGEYKPPVQTFENPSDFPRIFAELEKSLGEQLSTNEWQPIINAERNVSRYRNGMLPQDQFLVTKERPKLPFIVNNKEKLLDNDTLHMFERELNELLGNDYKKHLETPDKSSGQNRPLDLGKMAQIFQKVISQIPSSLQPPILLVGRTGTGKTTLTAHLLGIELERVEHWKNPYVRIKERAKYSLNISKDSSQPGTDILNIYELNNGDIICDPPGSKDKRGPEADIVNAMAMKLLTRIAGALKAIIVVNNEDDFNAERGRTSDLEETALMMNEILGTGKEAISKRSVIFSISRSKEENRGHIKKDLEKYYEENTTQFAQEVKTELEKNGSVKTSLIGEFLNVMKSGMKNMFASVASVASGFTNAMSAMDVLMSSTKKRLLIERANILGMVQLLLQDFDHNVIIPDVLDNSNSKDSSRQRILKRIEQASSLDSSELRFGQYSGAEDRFKYFVLSIAMHAKYKAMEQAELMNKVNELKKEILSLSREIHDKEEMTANTKKLLDYTFDRIKTIMEGSKINLEYPKDQTEFEHALADWKKSSPIYSVLLIYSPAQANWKPYLKTNIELLHSAESASKSIEAQTTTFGKTCIKEEVIHFEKELWKKLQCITLDNVKIFNTQELRSPMMELRLLATYGFEIGLDILSNDTTPTPFSEWKDDASRSFWAWWWYAGITQQWAIGCDNFTSRANPEEGYFKTPENSITEHNKYLEKVPNVSGSFKATFYGRYCNYSSRPNLEILVPAHKHPLAIAFIQEKRKLLSALESNKKTLEETIKNLTARDDNPASAEAERQIKLRQNEETLKDKQEKMHRISTEIEALLPLYHNALRVLKVNGLWTNASLENQLIQEFLDLFQHSSVNNIVQEIKDGKSKEFTYDAKKPLLTGRFPKNNKRVCFEEFDAASDGMCGFHVLGMTRKQVVSALLSYEDDPKVREFLAEEIKNALLGQFNEAGNFLSNEDQTFLKKYSDENAGVEAFVSKVNAKIREKNPLHRGLPLNELVNHIKTAADFAQFVKPSEEAQEKLKSAQLKLNTFCSTQTMYRQYVEKSLGKTGWLGYNSILLLAQINHFTVYIWKKSDDHLNQLKLINYHHAGENASSYSMLHTNGYTHFNLLAEVVSNEEKASDLSPSVAALVQNKSAVMKSAANQATPTQPTAGSNKPQLNLENGKKLGAS
jgi:hypothetical protein